MRKIGRLHVYLPGEQSPYLFVLLYLYVSYRRGLTCVAYPSLRAMREPEHWG